ncbi:hypothetical protein [Ruegeria arenilitoris]|uniref:hypothetical protein n=1 Tax=Ruegeria arenilitoris TaxID=1173585 RepID=UPI00148055A0|nr:hypothetical protein [Ruegeria arenilitoris]
MVKQSKKDLLPPLVGAEEIRSTPNENGSVNALMEVIKLITPIFVFLLAYSIVIASAASFVSVQM